MANHLQVFFIGQGGGLPGRTGNHNGVGPVLDLELDQFTELFIIHREVRMHRGNQCHAGTGKHG